MRANARRMKFFPKMCRRQVIQLVNNVPHWTAEDRHWLLNRRLLVTCDRLTPQPFLPKLRLTKYMQARHVQFRLVALLLALLFVGAQFHFCADFSASPAGSHICPICSTTQSAILATPPVIDFRPEILRGEAVEATISVFLSTQNSLSPRAPPAV